MPLIVLEGVDGSGKTVQFRMLQLALKDHNVPYVSLDFPRYDNPSSTLLRSYLNGEFGSDPNDVNPYAASMFFAVDRLASYYDSWQQADLENKLIIANRYSTSNIVHQGAKFALEDRLKFFEWVDTTEHVLGPLPRPDMVLFLDVPPTVSQTLRKKGERARDGDIHENNELHLEVAWSAAKSAAIFFKWERIDCAPVGHLRSPGDIHDEIIKRVNERFSLF